METLWNIVWWTGQSWVSEGYQKDVKFLSSIGCLLHCTITPSDLMLLRMVYVTLNQLGMNKGGYILSKHGHVG